MQQIWLPHHEPMPHLLIKEFDDTKASSNTFKDNVANGVSLQK
jgi:hypothetical protein